jgi:hypothetical protein
LLGHGRFRRFGCDAVEQQFELKVSFCKLIGDVLTCRVLATNIGKDRHLSLHQSRFVDDTGQEFRSTNVQVGSIDGNWGNDLVNGVPMSLTLEFDKVPSHLNYAHGEHPGRSPRSVEVTQG